MHQQKQRPTTLSARLPKRFALALKILFYADIAILIFQVAQMNRLEILANLPVFLVGGFALWILAHWIRLDQVKRPIYRLDEEGVLDKAYAGGGMQVRWDEIAAVEWTRWGGFRGLKLTLKDNPAALARLSRFDRFTAIINQVCYGSPLVLWQSWSDIPLEQYDEAIRERLSKN